jgi:CheY-like chemotaxis protein
MATVLVIDDEATIRDNLVRFLRLEGHNAIEAPDGLAGLAVIKAAPPDLIFCDVMMPHMDGFEVLAALQEDSAHRQIPFVFLSASAEPERLEQAMLRGASNYVTKPFNLGHLRDLLLRLLPSGAPK